MVRRKRRFGLAKETQLMEQAARRKMSRYTSSGLLIIIIGLLVIFAGFALHTGAYSLEGLVIGIGAITVLVGIIRALIGLINPSTPAELRYVTGEPLPGDVIEVSSDEKEAISLEELTYRQPAEEE